MNDLEAKQIIRRLFRTKAGMTAEEAEELRVQSGASKCERSGRCCRAILCIPAEMLLGPTAKNCPFLKPEGCAMVAAMMGTEYENTIREVMSIGCGCPYKKEKGHAA